MLLNTVGAKSSSSAANTQSTSSKPGTVPLVSATSRIIHPEEDTSLVSCCLFSCLFAFPCRLSGGFFLIQVGKYNEFVNVWNDKCHCQNQLYVGSFKTLFNLKDKGKRKTL